MVSGLTGSGYSTYGVAANINIGSETPGVGNSVIRLEREGALAFQMKNTNKSGFWKFDPASPTPPP